MSNFNSSSGSDGIDPKNIVSVTSGGESVTQDPAGAKADARAEMNDEICNRNRGATRRYFNGMLIVGGIRY